MASNRHLGRIIALQTLYELDFRRESEDKDLDLQEVLTRNVGRYQKQVDDTEFIEALVKGVAEHEAELDAQLQPIAPEWPIDQIARMDRVVLRMGLYELLHNSEIPPKVVINEAVELAKSFGGENSSKFINGVLGTVMRQIFPDEQAVVVAGLPTDAVTTVDDEDSATEVEAQPIKQKTTE